MICCTGGATLFWAGTTTDFFVGVTGTDLVGVGFTTFWGFTIVGGIITAGIGVLVVTGSPDAEVVVFGIAVFEEFFCVVAGVGIVEVTPDAEVVVFGVVGVGVFAGVGVLLVVVVTPDAEVVVFGVVVLLIVFVFILLLSSSQPSSSADTFEIQSILILHFLRYQLKEESFTDNR